MKELKDIFLPETPEIEKKASMESSFLSEDSTQWVKEIIGLFLQKFPYLQNEKVSISWTKKNDDKGTAVGNLNVLNGSVPIIIKDFMMEPLDVFLVEGITVPLNDYFLQTIYQKPEAFEGLAPRERILNDMLFSNNSSLQYSPTNQTGAGGGNNSVTRDAVKVASVLDSLDYINKEDAIEVLEALKDPIVKEAYENNNTIDLFEKIAQKALLNTKQASFEDYLRNLDIDRQWVYSDSFGNHFVKQASSKVNKTWERTISASEAAELEEILANTKTLPNLEKTASYKEEKSVEIEKGSYGRIKTNYNNEEAYSPQIDVLGVEKLAQMPKIASFKVKNGEDEFLAITKEGNYSYRATPSQNNLNYDDFEGSDPKMGDFGVFMTKEASTIPFEITNMVKSPGIGQWVIKGESGLQKVAYYPLKSTFSGFEPHDSGADGHYWAPGDAKWVKLANRDEKIKQLQDFEAKLKIHGLNGFTKEAYYVVDEDIQVEKVKEGVWKVGKNFDFIQEEEFPEMTKNAGLALKTHSAYRDRSGLWSFKGTEFEKYAKEAPIRNLSDNEAIWTAIHCGATEDDIEKIASLKLNHSYELEGELSAPITIKTLQEKVAKLEDSEGPKLKIAKNLIKEAAHFRNKDSVDAILSLSLLRKRNVKTYINAIPQYESVLSELGNLLLASRMGLEETNPDALKEAFDSLSDVVIQLHNLRAAVKDVK